MSDRNYTLLFAQLSSFRIIVLANRLGCTNDLARRAHDKLIQELEQLIGFLREEAKASLALVRNPDSADVEDLMERRYNAQRNLDDYRYDGPHPLLDYIHIDHATGEWWDNEAQTWRFLADCHPVMNDVSDRTLGGLRDIMQQIWWETRFRFSAYLDWKSSAQVDDEVFYEVPPVCDADENDEYDPESDYELLHGPDW